MESGQLLSKSQPLMSKALLKKMGNELVRLCDGIERHGLVDYQYGVWEDRIIASKYMLTTPYASYCIRIPPILIPCFSFRRLPRPLRDPS